MEAVEQGQATITARTMLPEATHIASRLGEHELSVSIVPTTMHTKISLAVSLLHWLSSMVSLSDGLCRVLCDYILEHEALDPFATGEGCGKYPALCYMILGDTVLPKPMIHGVHSVFMALLADPMFKRAFAIAFTIEYEHVYSDFVRGLGTSQDTILSFGVQFLNRASFVKLVVEEYDLFRVLLRSLQISFEETIIKEDTTLKRKEFGQDSLNRFYQELNQCTLESTSEEGRKTLITSILEVLSSIDETIEDKSPTEFQLSVQNLLGKLDVQQIGENWLRVIRTLATEYLPGSIYLDITHRAFEHRRYSNCVMDLRYVVQIDGITHEFVTGHRTPRRLMISDLTDLTCQANIFISIAPVTPYQKFLRLLSYLQGVFPQRRKTGEHVRYETRGWISTIDLVVTLGDVCPGILQRFLRPLETSSAPQTSYSVAQLVLVTARPLLEELILWIHNTGFEPDDAFSVKDKPVSCHYPLHRCLAQLYRECAAVPNAMDCFLDLIRTCLPTAYRMTLFEYPLRGIVQAAQVHAGLWVRNGRPVFHHTLNYSEPTLCTRLRDLDLTLLQLAVVVLDAETVLSRIIKLFDVGNWFFHPTKEMPNTKDQQIVLADECLTLICQLSTELVSPPASTRRDDDVLRREIIHRLAVGPCAHSDITKIVQELTRSGDPIEIEVVNQILMENSVRVNGTSGKYQLKEELYNEYDATFPHLTRHDHEVAREQWVQKRTKATDRALPAVVVPSKCHPELLATRLVVLNPMILVMIQKTLLRALAHHGEYASTTYKESHSVVILSKTLHLLTLQVHAIEYLMNESKNVEVMSYTTQDSTTGLLLRNQFFSDLMKNHDGEPSVLEALVVLEPILSDKSIRWILLTLASLHDGCKQYIQVQSSSASAEDEQAERKAVLAKRKAEAQKRAIDMMKQRQNAFASQMDTGETDEVLEEKESSSLPDCAMCHEEMNGFMCYVGFAQRSGVIGQNYINRQENVTGTPLSTFRPRPMVTPLEKRNVDENVPLYMQLCGHALHYSCWNSYHASQFQLVITGGQSDGQHAIDVTKGEFLCPLCKSISNILVPYIPCSRGTSENVVTEDVKQWLEDPTTGDSISDESKLPSKPWMEGLATLCMGLHRVATGSSERARPDRYIRTACRSLSYTIAVELAINEITPEKQIEIDQMINCMSWISDLPDLKKPMLSLKADNDMTIGETVRFQVKSLLLYGGARIRSDGGIEYEQEDISIGQTRKQSAWKGARFPRKPLLLTNLLPSVAEGLILMKTRQDMMMTLRFVMLARLVQCVLAWTAQLPEDSESTTSPRVWTSEEETKDFDINACAEFFQSKCGVSSVSELVEFQNFIVESTPFRAVSNENASSLLGYVSYAMKHFFQVQDQLVAICLSDDPSIPNLPTISDLMTSEFFKSLLKTWITRLCDTYQEIQDPEGQIERWRNKNGTTHEQLIHQDIIHAIGWNGRPPLLPPLPKAYVTLYSQLTKRTCALCNQFPARPVICLLCGELQCAASTCPKREDGPPGSCTLHTKSCGKGTGLYFLVLEGSVLLVYRARAAYFPSMYVDEYGEEFGERHKYLNRGRPLHLDMTRYETLHRMWFKHEIPTHVVRIQNGSERVIRNSHY